MHIVRVEIKGFGRIRNLALLPVKGLNIVFGPNEAGKSTVQRFIRAAFYGVRSGRQCQNGLPAPNKRFMPWDGAPYGGAVSYMLDDGSFFRAERDFEKNTLRIYDADYNEISGMFKIGRDKLPMFAEAHLGMDEATFNRTVFIEQMEVRVGSSESSELAARLTNVSDTGLEGLSFQKAEAALTNALKSGIGTDRTRTQPLDKLEARLKQLEGEHTRLQARQKQQQSLKEELSDIKEQLFMLEAQEQFLVKVGELIEIRKKIDAGIKKEAGLREAAALLEETDRRLASVRERQTAGVDRGCDKIAGQRTDDLVHSSQRRRSVKKGKGFNSSLAISIICFIAALLTGSLFLSGYTAAYQDKMPALMYLYGACALIWSIAGVILLFKGSKEKAENNTLKRSSDTRITTGAGDPDADVSASLLVHERVEELTVLKKNTLSSVSLVYGNPLEDAEGIKMACFDVRVDLEQLSMKLQRGLEEAEAMEHTDDGCFGRRDLDVLIYDTDVSTLESQLKTETEKTRAALFDTAMKEKYCEGTISDEAENSDELQRVEEETVAVKEKIAYLRNKADAIKLARDVLMEAAAEIRRDFAPGLNNEMSSIAAGLTGQRYTDLRGDEKLALKALVPEQGDVRNVFELSGGTTDQMYLAMRLAMTGLLTSGSESLPLMMDEVFSQFDDKRTAIALEYLHNEYSDKQIFIFTCKSREVELARQVFGDRINLLEL